MPNERIMKELTGIKRNQKSYMEPFINEQTEQDEEERLKRHYERIERMRYEKQQQQKRRQFIRTYWPVGAGGLAVLMLIVVLVTVWSGKSAEQNGQQEQKGTATGQSTEVILGALVVAGDGQNGIGEIGNEAMPGGEANGAGTPGNEESDINEANGEISYQFETTSDTVTIYSQEVISTHAILINESTNTIVASKNPKERISPASMTKVLTILVAAERIAEEELDNPFTITLEYTDYAYINECSTAGFLKDEQVTVRDLFYGTILPSGGDAAVALACYVAGSHEAFVELMNEKLEELGLADSAHFTNCVGLYDKEHYCTVYDMAVIMKAALQNDFCKEVLAAHTYTTTANELHPEGNLLSNWFLRRIEDKDTGGEVLCAKTGYVVQSQSCAVSYGIFAEGTPYICVTAGSGSSWSCIYDHVEIYNRYVQ